MAQTYPRDEDCSIVSVVYLHSRLGDYAEGSRAAQRGVSGSIPTSGEQLRQFDLLPTSGSTALAEAKVHSSRAMRVRIKSIPLGSLSSFIWSISSNTIPPAWSNKQLAAMGIPGCGGSNVFLESETAACGGPIHQGSRPDATCGRFGPTSAGKRNGRGISGTQCRPGSDSWQLPTVAKEDAQSAMAEIKGKNA